VTTQFFSEQVNNLLLTEMSKLNDIWFVGCGMG